METHVENGRRTDGGAGGTNSELCEAVFINSSVDLLNDGAFDEVARLEDLQVVGVELSGFGNLDYC